MFGFAWWKSATIWFQTSSSAGSPHIIMLISTGPVAAGFGPPQAASSRLAATRTNIDFFMLLSFLGIKFDDGRQVIGTVWVKALCQGTVERGQLQHRQIQHAPNALRNSRFKRH